MDFIFLFAFGVTFTINLPFVRTSTEKSDQYDKIRKIESFMKSTLASSPYLPGASLAVVLDGHVFMTRGFGFADIDNSMAADENTTFGIASLTKAFTATLVIKLLHEHGLTVDTKIRDVLGDEVMFSDVVRTELSTVADLLSHRLGIPSYNVIRYQSNISRENLIGYVRRFKPVCDFRDCFHYSNLNYGLTAKLTETLGEGDTWETLMERHILQPAGMRNSFLRSDYAASRDNVAKGYHRTRHGRLRAIPDDFTRHWGRLGGSGSIMASAIDMVKWIQININSGQEAGGIQIIPSEVIKSAHRARVVVASGGNPLRDKYGSGWTIARYRGWKTISHVGNTYGYSSLIAVTPGRKFGLYVAFNGQENDLDARMAVFTFVFDSLLKNVCGVAGDDEPPPPHTFTNTRSPVRRSRRWRRSAFVRPRSAYVGTFSSNEYGELVVARNSTTKRLELTYGIVRFRLYPDREPDVFRHEPDDVTWFLYGSKSRFHFDVSQSLASSVSVEGLQPKTGLFFVNRRLVEMDEH